MRALIQRVKRAGVSVEGESVGSIGTGLLVLLGIRQGDTDADARYLAAKVANLRVFPDAEGRMNLSVLEAGGEALVVSQFTLYGDCRKGRRPSYASAADPGTAEPLYTRFCALLGAEGLRVETGVFGASMDVELVNWGPVTLALESEGG